MGSEFKFQVSTGSVPVGQSVTISFTNHGTIQHNLTSDATGVHLVAQPGQTVSTTVVFPAPGDFDFVCTIAGHKEAGMQTKVAAAATTQTGVAVARVSAAVA